MSFTCSNLFESEFMLRFPIKILFGFLILNFLISNNRVKGSVSVELCLELLCSDLCPHLRRMWMHFKITIEIKLLHRTIISECSKWKLS